MINKAVLFLILLVLVSSCHEKWIDKPENLIPEKQMVNILVDMQLATSLYQARRNQNIPGDKLTPEVFYYSVLKKYNVADTVFEKSILYYSSYPKDFEKMYAKVLDRFSEMELEYTGKSEKPVDVGNLKEE